MSYYNGNSYTFTWEKGRRLSSATKGTSVTTFEYNEDGIRTSKTVNGVEHIYYLNGSQILAEVWGNNICIYLYDESGAPIGMRYRNSTYAEAQFDTFWYTKNLQGDIVGVYNDEGVLVRSYVYDAWGVVKATIHNNTGTNANSSYNPFFYRGYYYDIQLGLYYLNSRYYDPATCRFISPDGYISTGQGFTGYNMFSYCGNNPVSRADESGQFWGIVVAAIVGVVAIGCALTGCDASNGKSYSGEETDVETTQPSIKAYSTYGDGTGNVYFVDNVKAAIELESNINNSDVVIIDNRTASDPNMQMRHSYKITNNKHQKEIAQIMLNYNDDNLVNPAWSRTLKSIVQEWDYHNYAYSFNVKRDRTAHTDFNNADEGKNIFDYIWRAIQ